MAIRSLDQVLAELGTAYNPQIDLIRKQQSLIPEEIAGEEQGLQAKQAQSFEDIVSGARRRGIGFSGIPLAEQARYTSTEFLPALARLKQSGRQKALSLEEAILGINERRNAMAHQLRQGDVDNDFRERNFEFEKQKYGEQMAEARRQAAASAAAARASAFAPTYGGGSVGGTPTAPVTIRTGGNNTKTNPLQQSAYDDIKRISKGGSAAIVSDFNAAKKWYEKTGDQRDLFKLEMYKEMFPQYLGKATWKQALRY